MKWVWIILLTCMVWKAGKWKMVPTPILGWLNVVNKMKTSFWVKKGKVWGWGQQSGQLPNYPYLGSPLHSRCWEEFTPTPRINKKALSQVSNYPLIQEIIFLKCILVSPILNLLRKRMKHFIELQNSPYGFSDGHLLLRLWTPTTYNFMQLQATTGWIWRQTLSFYKACGKGAGTPT